ncbi:HNH endonuclease signature motif containing protein [Mailhella sp.]
MELSELLKNFDSEKECVYKEEHYSVRDNGSILRHPKEGKKPRKLDNIWTFGILDSKTGYLIYGGERVHRIVATAFHGTPPNSEYVVDHINTNRQDNNSINLRWVTRLENILLNEVTRKKIEQLTGLNIEDVLKNISILKNYTLPLNLSWMSTVSQEESIQSLEKWKAWARNPRPSANGAILWDKDIRKSRTWGAAQKNWFPAGVFYCCPRVHGASPLIAYSKNIHVGDLFFTNEYGAEYRVIEFSLTDEKNKLCLKCHTTKEAITLCLIEITYENNYFVHSQNHYWTDLDLEKHYTLALGREWTGGDTFGDFIA